MFREKPDSLDIPRMEQHGYKAKLDDLQTKIKKSKMEHRQLELEFQNLMMQKGECDRSALKAYRNKYNKLVEEDRRRIDRNERLKSMLERIDYQAAALAAKTERLKLLKAQYELHLMRYYGPHSGLPIYTIPSPPASTVSDFDHINTSHPLYPKQMTSNLDKNANLNRSPAESVRSILKSDRSYTASNLSNLSNFQPPYQPLNNYMNAASGYPMMQQQHMPQQLPYGNQPNLLGGYLNQHPIMSGNYSSLPPGGGYMPTNQTPYGSTMGGTTGGVSGNIGNMPRLSDYLGNPGIRPMQYYEARYNNQFNNNPGNIYQSGDSNLNTNANSTTTQFLHNNMTSVPGTSYSPQNSIQTLNQPYQTINSEIPTVNVSGRTSSSYATSAPIQLPYSNSIQNPQQQQQNLNEITKVTSTAPTTVGAIQHERNQEINRDELKSSPPRQPQQQQQQQQHSFEPSRQYYEHNLNANAKSTPSSPSPHNETRLEMLGRAEGFLPPSSSAYEKLNALSKETGEVRELDSDPENLHQVWEKVIDEEEVIVKSPYSENGRPQPSFPVKVNESETIRRVGEKILYKKYEEPAPFTHKATIQSTMIGSPVLNDTENVLETLYNGIARLGPGGDSSVHENGSHSNGKNGKNGKNGESDVDGSTLFNEAAMEAVTVTRTPLSTVNEDEPLNTDEYNRAAALLQYPPAQQQHSSDVSYQDNQYQQNYDQDYTQQPYTQQSSLDYYANGQTYQDPTQYPDNQQSQQQQPLKDYQEQPTSDIQQSYQSIVEEPSAVTQDYQQPSLESQNYQTVQQDPAKSYQNDPQQQYYTTETYSTTQPKVSDSIEYQNTSEPKSLELSESHSPAVTSEPTSYQNEDAPVVSQSGQNDYMPQVVGEVDQHQYQSTEITQINPNQYDQPSQQAQSDPSQYQPTDATSGYQPTDATTGYQTTDVTSGYQTTDVTSGYQPTDTISGYQPTNIASEYQPTDTTSGYQPTDVTSGYQPTDVTSGYQPTDVALADQNQYQSNDGSQVTPDQYQTSVPHIEQSQYQPTDSAQENQTLQYQTTERSQEDQSQYQTTDGSLANQNQYQPSDGQQVDPNQYQSTDQNYQNYQDPNNYQNYDQYNAQQQNYQQYYTGEQPGQNYYTENQNQNYYQNYEQPNSETSGSQQYDPNVQTVDGQPSNVEQSNTITLDQYAVVPPTEIDESNTTASYSENILSFPATVTAPELAVSSESDVVVVPPSAIVKEPPKKEKKRVNFLDSETESVSIKSTKSQPDDSDFDFSAN